ncbi:hypothetical protein BKA82DRAFT_4342650 [Pisolithus tinctorius]|nr:hypothetical protein BKA82DRAFT_4342650 [Pisolithus tinctorius]
MGGAELEASSCDRWPLAVPWPVPAVATLSSTSTLYYQTGHTKMGSWVNTLSKHGARVEGSSNDGSGHEFASAHTLNPAGLDTTPRKSNIRRLLVSAHRDVGGAGEIGTRLGTGGYIAIPNDAESALHNVDCATHTQYVGVFRHERQSPPGSKGKSQLWLNRLRSHRHRGTAKLVEILGQTGVNYRGHVLHLLISLHSTMMVVTAVDTHLIVCTWHDSLGCNVRILVPAFWSCAEKHRQDLDFQCQGYQFSLSNSPFPTFTAFSHAALY